MFHTKAASGLITAHVMTTFDMTLVIQHWPLSEIQPGCFVGAVGRGAVYAWEHLMYLAGCISCIQ
jgi:hypothetical protein